MSNNIPNDNENSKQDVKKFMKDFEGLNDAGFDDQVVVSDVNNIIEEDGVYMKTTEPKQKNKKPMAADFENYLKDTGISDGFELIFTELLMKNIKKEDYFSYTASRLRDMGRKLDKK
jgi:hypothetical protein